MTAQARAPVWSQVALITHIRLFLATLKSPVLPLHYAHILLSIFLFHFSTTYLLLPLEEPGVSECLGFQRWSQECYAHLYTVAAGKGHLKRGLPDPQGLCSATLVITTGYYPVGAPWF